jgi:hypothetical protein
MDFSAEKTRRKGRGAIIILELRFEARYHWVPNTKTWGVPELTTIMGGWDWAFGTKKYGRIPIKT